MSPMWGCSGPRRDRGDDSQMRHPGVDVGTTLAGRFKIIGYVGGGGMAFVYRAVDLKHDRPAAVKVLQTRQTRTEEFRRRFEREANLAERGAHPHILPIWDAGEDHGVFYIAMPLADHDLGAMIESHPQGIDPRRAIRIVTQIAHALDFAHARGIIHRDVKPENIVVLEGQAVGDYAYLTDFGIAKDVGSDEQLTGTHLPMSPSTAAPEQIAGKGTLDGRVDQYALACTLYEALSGKTPFTADNARDMLIAHMFHDPAPISTINASLPVALNNVFAKGLAKAPDERYASCQELVERARDALGVATETDAEPVVPPRDTRHRDGPEQDLPRPGTARRPGRHHGRDRAGRRNRATRRAHGARARAAGAAHRGLRPPSAGATARGSRTTIAGDPRPSRSRSRPRCTGERRSLSRP